MSITILLITTRHVWSLVQEEKIHAKTRVEEESRSYGSVERLRPTKDHHPCLHLQL